MNDCNNNGLYNKHNKMSFDAIVEKLDYLKNDGLMLYFHYREMDRLTLIVLAYRCYFIEAFFLNRN